MTIVYCINIANRRSTVMIKYESQESIVIQITYPSLTIGWDDERRGYVKYYLKKVGDVIYVHWHIIQSQKQTQEKDMWNPKVKFAKPKKDHKIYSTKDLKERCSQTGDRGRKVVLLVELCPPRRLCGRRQGGRRGGFAEEDADGSQSGDLLVLTCSLLAW